MNPPIPPTTWCAGARDGDAPAHQAPVGASHSMSTMAGELPFNPGVNL
jgi:hypothetical protein